MATKKSDQEAAGPNEAATGQDSPADDAKTVSDPQASGDAGTTAGEYGEDAPASLGPDMPQSDAEQAAHDATAAQLEAAEATGGVPAEPVAGTADKPYTPEEALRVAVERAQAWKTPPSDSNE